MTVAVRRLVIGACLVVSGLAVTVRPASAQVADQQVTDQAVVATEQATVNFDVPAVAQPKISWIGAKPAKKVSFSNAAPVQSTDSGIGFGALVGFVRTSPNGELDGVDIEFNTGNGWMAGIWFGGNRDGVLGFMGEVSYVVKKASQPGDDIETEIGYIEIPAVFRVNIGQRSKNGVSVYGMAGPVFDFKINDNADDFGLDDDAFEQFQIGILAGLGIEVTRFAFEVRGNWGLREIISTDLTENAKIKTFTLQIVGKFRFN